LAVEEQFYLLWPLILVFALARWGKNRRALLFGILAGVAMSTIEMAILYHPYTDPSRVYYGTDTRVAALLLGAALAFVWAPWRLAGKTGRNAGILLDIVAVLSAFALFWMFLNVEYFDPNLWRGGFLVAALVSAVVIAATVHPASRLTPWVLGFAVFRWIGVRSYGIYLWHWPIYMVTRAHSDLPITGLPLLALRLTLTFAAAAASYKFIEEPIRHGAIERRWALYRSSSRETRKKIATGFAWIAVFLSAGLVVIVLGFADGGTPVTPAGFPRQASVHLKAGQVTTTTVPGTSTSTAGPTTTTILAAGTPPPTVTAIGDSVMLGAYQQLITTVDGMFGAQVTGMDAAESRQFSAGVDKIQELKNANQLGQDVIVQLGTNGTIDPAEFDRMMGLLSDRKKVVIINAKVPRSWEGQVNETLAAGVKRYKNAVLLDWHGYASQHPEFFYDDEIHLRPDGAAAYAQFVAGSLGAGTP
jgi:hypothetical protein